MTKSARLSWWTIVFLLTTIFQIYRGTLSDVLIFGSITALMLSQNIQWVEKLSLQFRFKLTPLVTLVTTALGLALYISHRHSIAMAAIFIALIPFIAVVAISHDELHDHPDKAGAKRAEILWAIWAVAMSLAELVAYICSRLFGNEEKYPTISVLIQPEFSGGWFKAIFIALWLPTGAWLLIQGQKK